MAALPEVKISTEWKTKTKAKIKTKQGGLPPLQSVRCSKPFGGAREFLGDKGCGTTTPLFLIATAGMRRLKQQNYESFSILKKAIINHINGSGFKDLRFDVITGDDEGFLWRWVGRVRRLPFP